MASKRQVNRQEPEKEGKRSKLENFGPRLHRLTAGETKKGARRSATLRTLRAEQHRNFVMAATAYDIPSEFFKAIDKKLWKKGELLLKAMEKAGFDFNSSEESENRKQKVELSGKVDSKLEIEITGVEVQ